eukprot:1419510-Amphidinium_carterae.1
MLVVLGELGDTPTPNALDTQSLEDFTDMLATAVQARQAARANTIRSADHAGPGEEDLASSNPQSGPRTHSSERRPFPFSQEYVANLEARLQAAN